MGKIYLHPDYKPDVAYYDLAIVKVSHVEYSNTITPICLPTRVDPSGHRHIGQTVTVTGWGSYNVSNIPSDHLKTAPLSILPAA